MIDLEEALQLLNDSEKAQRAFLKHGEESDFDRYRLLKDIALLVYQSKFLPQDLQQRIATLRSNHAQIRFAPEKVSEIAKFVLAAVYVEHLTIRSCLATNTSFDNAAMETQLKELLTSVESDFLELEKDCLKSELTQVVSNYGNKEEQVFDFKLAFNKLIVLLVALILEQQPIWEMVTDIELMAAELGRDGANLIVLLHRVKQLADMRYRISCVEEAATSDAKLTCLCSMLGVYCDTQEAVELLAAFDDINK